MCRANEHPPDTLRQTSTSHDELCIFRVSVGPWIFVFFSSWSLAISQSVRYIVVPVQGNGLTWGLQGASLGLSRLERWIKDEISALRQISKALKTGVNFRLSCMQQWRNHAISSRQLYIDRVDKCGAICDRIKAGVQSVFLFWIIPSDEAFTWSLQQLCLKNRARNF